MLWTCFILNSNKAFKEGRGLIFHFLGRFGDLDLDSWYFDFLCVNLNGNESVEGFIDIIIICWVLVFHFKTHLKQIEGLSFTLKAPICFFAFYRRKVSHLLSDSVDRDLFVSVRDIKLVKYATCVVDDLDGNFVEYLAGGKWCRSIAPRAILDVGRWVDVGGGIWLSETVYFFHNNYKRLTSFQMTIFVKE